MLLSSGQKIRVTIPANNMKFIYEFVGIDFDAGDIVLYNCDLNEQVRVDVEWFRQRKIKMLEELAEQC